MSFSEQQTRAANELLDGFCSCHYALLKALWQSGKTGAYNCLIQKMIENRMIDRVYIISGINETGLRSQVRADAYKYNPTLYENKAIQIHFGQNEYTSRRVIDITRALIVVDESHLVQDRTEILSKFLEHNGIYMSGRDTELVRNSTYVLSVSATPYAEIGAFFHKETLFEKKIVDLEPGENYIGLKEYRMRGHLLPTFDIKTKIVDFERLLGEHERKYILMRLPDSYRAASIERVIRSLCEAKGYSMRYYNSNSKKPQVAITRDEQEKIGGDIPCLEDEPSRTMVVILYGCLRAGKVVPKKHIGFVWEGASEPNTDSLTQALPGRMCGYDFGQAPGTRFTGTLPFIFVPPSVLKKGKDGLSEMDRALSNTPRKIGEKVGGVSPRRGKNLQKGHESALPTSDRTPCCPLRLTWSEPDIYEQAYHHERSSHHKRADWLKDRAYNLLKANLHLIEESSNYEHAQKEEMLAYVRRTGKSSRRYYDSSRVRNNITQYNSLKKAHADSTIPTENVKGHAPLAFIFADSTFEGLEGRVEEAKYVYVLFNTQSKGNELNIPLSRRVPRTNGKSHFSDNFIPPLVSEEMEPPAQVSGGNSSDCSITEEPASGGAGGAPNTTGGLHRKVRRKLDTTGISCTSSSDANTCPVSGGSSGRVEAEPVSGGSSGHTETESASNGSSGHTETEPVSDGSSGRTETEPVSGGSSGSNGRAGTEPVSGGSSSRAETEPVSNVSGDRAETEPVSNGSGGRTNIVLASEVSASIIASDSLSCMNARTAPVTVAIGMVSITDETLRTPEIFEAALREYLVHWSTSIYIQYSRCFKSIGDRFTLSKSSYHWSSFLEHDAERACMRLNAEFGITLCIQYDMSPNDDTYYIRCITW